MAKLVSIEKAKDFGVTKEKNGKTRTDYIAKCVFTNAVSKWVETGASALFSMNLTLTVSSIEEGEKQISEFFNDTTAHAAVNCYEFTIAKLLESTEYAGTTSIKMSETRNDVQIRRIASFDTETKVFERERARIIHRLKNNTFHINA